MAHTRLMLIFINLAHALYCTAVVNFKFFVQFIVGTFFHICCSCLCIQIGFDLDFRIFICVCSPCFVLLLDLVYVGKVLVLMGHSVCLWLKDSAPAVCLSCKILANILALDKICYKIFGNAQFYAFLNQFNATILSC